MISSWKRIFIPQDIYNITILIQTSLYFSHSIFFSYVITRRIAFASSSDHLASRSNTSRSEALGRHSQRVSYLLRLARITRCADADRDGDPAPPLMTEPSHGCPPVGVRRSEIGRLRGRVFLWQRMPPTEESSHANADDKGGHGRADGSNGARKAVNIRSAVGRFRDR